MEDASKTNGAAASPSAPNGPLAPTVATPDPSTAPPSALPKRKRRNGVSAAASASASTATTPAEPAAPTPPTPPPAPTPAASPPAAPPVLQSPSARFERIAQVDIAEGEKEGDGWEEGASALLYDAESNQYRPMQVLCTDVRFWGSIGDAIICRSKAPVIVRLADGELFEVPPGETFAMLAVNELVNIANKLESVPDGVVEAKVAPIGRRYTETGLSTVHYRVRYRVVKGLSRKDAWRGA